MIPAPHPDDAFAYITERLRENPNGYLHQGRMYDVWLPSIVGKYLQAAGHQFPQADLKNDERFEGVWRAFYDAAWRLCCMSILRPTVVWSRYTQVGTPAAGDGYSYTSSGRSWLQSSELLFIPADPGRYLSLLSKEVGRLGKGFAQRAREAAACHQAINYLACCAMSGAAAESALLAVAIAKTGDESKVLKEYAKPNGRRYLAELVFGRQPSTLHQRFVSSAFQLLAYWRDEAAHGQASQISELDAYYSLTALVRLAQFLHSEWGDLTK